MSIPEEWSNEINGFVQGIHVLISEDYEKYTQRLISLADEIACGKYAKGVAGMEIYLYDIYRTLYFASLSPTTTGDGWSKICADLKCIASADGDYPPKFIPALRIVHRALFP